MGAGCSWPSSPAWVWPRYTPPAAPSVTSAWRAHLPRAPVSPSEVLSEILTPPWLRPPPGSSPRVRPANPDPPGPSCQSLEGLEVPQFAPYRPGRRRAAVSQRPGAQRRAGSALPQDLDRASILLDSVGQTRPGLQSPGPDAPTRCFRSLLSGEFTHGALLAAPYPAPHSCHFPPNFPVTGWVFVRVTQSRRGESLVARQARAAWQGLCVGWAPFQAFRPLAEGSVASAVPCTRGDAEAGEEAVSRPRPRSRE